jgi:hypothetical protein
MAARAAATAILGLWTFGSAAFAGITSPDKFLGFRVGADYHLATYDQAVGYLRLLEKETPRLKVFEMGKTGMGRSMIYAVIASEETMGNLDRYREISRKLALVEGLTDDQAHALAAEGKAVVWIDVGIHASECAPAQHALELAYDLVADDDAATKLIRDNTILLLVFANPDGMQMIADWYRGNLGTPFETAPLPYLYNRYAGHDNNRDSYANNLIETQNITRLLNGVWSPVVLYDHHQTAPFPARIWIPPAAEPTNPNLHPLFIRGKNLIGSAMGYAFDREGKDGAISRFQFDFIYPGYEDSFGDFFHIISIMTETALYAYATPRFYTVRDFPEEFRDFTPSVFYPSPWKGGWWRLRDAVEYCLTGSKAVLETAALYREAFLFGKYKMGKDTAARFAKEPPYAWVIPREQWDPPTAALLVEKMLLQGIKVCQAAAPFTADGLSYPAGTWVIPMNQPFARFVKAVFEEQSYPDLTKYPDLWQGIVAPRKSPNAYLPPYDLAGWSLPFQMGVKATRVNTPLQASLTQIPSAGLAGSVAAGPGPFYLVSPKTNNSYTAVNRILAKGGEVRRLKDDFSAGGITWPAGTFLVRASSLTPKFMAGLARDLSLEIGTGSPPAADKSARIQAPRIALYKPWLASSDEGWTRWILERFEFPFVNVENPEIRAGSLRSRFDVLIIPSMPAEAVINGFAPGTMPPAYVGGIGDEGVRNIERFVGDGGTLVTLNDGCQFAVDALHLPVSDGLRTVRRADGGGAPEFACPGSILRLDFNPKHPVAYGMPEHGAGFFDNSPGFQINPEGGGGKAAEIIASYPDDALLISGYLKGEKYLRRKIAAAAFSVDRGKAVLLGFPVQNRAQPAGTFKLLFNALFYGSPRPDNAPEKVIR